MGLVEIDLATGKEKKGAPLKDALDYGKWDQLANRVTEHEGEEGEVAEYFWQELPHAGIRVRVPVWGKTKSKQCRVDFKLNWLTVWAPPPEAVVGYYKDNEPPKEPLLDFQLYGAVNVDECDWEIVDDGAIRTIIINLHRAPVYKWPSLHRPNGLKSESERKPKMAEEQAKWKRMAEEEAKARANQSTVEYEECAGPSRPPVYGPEPRGPRRPHKPKGVTDNQRPPGSYERGRIIVSEPPEFTDSSDDEPEPEPTPHAELERMRVSARTA